MVENKLIYRSEIKQLMRRNSIIAEMTSLLVRIEETVSNGTRCYSLGRREVGRGRNFFSTQRSSHEVRLGPGTSRVPQELWPERMSRWRSHFLHSAIQHLGDPPLVRLRIPSGLFGTS